SGQEFGLLVPAERDMPRRRVTKVGQRSIRKGDVMKNSKIEWTNHTFNPWIGCTKVSPGCANCYAETLMDTRYGRVHWGKGKPRVRTSADNWAQPIIWNRHC